MKTIKNLNKEQRGSSIVIMALGLALAISLIGLVIDGGHLYMTQSHLQKTANASALSGAQELMNSDEAVNEVVDEVLNAHGERESFLDTVIENEQSLKVDLEKPVPVFFSSLFGVETVTLRADAKVEISTIGEAAGAVPFGIDESTILHYGETYDLKVDAGDSEAGNFGILALEGPGAKTYEETLKFGYEETLKVGDVVNTQTGNIAGPTENGVNYRMDACPEGNIYDRDCERIMTVLVYKPVGDSSNFKQVEITGFAYFYLQERMGKNDDSVRGTFIKRVGAGTAGRNSADRGAYTGRLTQ
ncbi:Tad domain-containing protein [Alteribacillus sp. YIM 98480]|uniref:Tad domain-containing protein n=1 Tax=Alteribacillus sp. YIM 98480 TaxID=2606599 RepID=UPI00131DCA83|nr:Tad domain-containing protein [Alteribacillus sp. YIM 98480]